MSIPRRSFLKKSSLVAVASALPVRWVSAEDLPKNRKIKLRFAVASDLHYANDSAKMAKKAKQLVGWINKEKKENGLDALILNGDIGHDRADTLLLLRNKYLKKLKVPYYCGKGNHDYVDEKPGSPAESWEKIWGYPANHSFVLNDFAFVMADTSAPKNFRPYLPADIDFLKAAFEKHREAPAIFVMIHIAQRKEAKDGWPKFGVHGSRSKEGEAVMELIESTPNVKAIFHGHNHDEAGVWESGDKRYMFTSHAGGWWGGPKGYRIVEIDDQHRILTYQVNAEEGGELNRNVLLT
ncbi:MAG: metallophosphoesterase [Akkermansiaceae bacterium]